jgi:integrase
MSAKNLTPLAKQFLNPADKKTQNKILEYINISSAPATKLAYTKHLGRFRLWLDEHDFSFPCQPWHVAKYLIDETERRLQDEGQPYKRATLSAWMVAISLGHLSLGFDNPVNNIIVQKVYQGLCNRYGVPQERARALTRNEVVRMIGTETDNHIRDQRDRALIIIGFTGGFRTDELVRIECTDIYPVRHEKAKGYAVRLRKTKTDQKGIGRDVYIPYAGARISPAKELEAWLKVVKVGRLFRSVKKDGTLGETLTTRAIIDILKDRAHRAQVDDWDMVSGHSLRRGYVTSAHNLGFDNHAIAKQTGQTVQTVDRYIEDLDLFENNPATKLF